MIPTLLVMTLLAVFTATPEAWAQSTTQQFEYATKFVCGEPSDSPEQVVKGHYATAVNIHNPSLSQTYNFAWKVAVAYPGMTPGPISGFVSAALKADQAFEIDCGDILRVAFPGPVPVPAFAKGFLVILTPFQLDVVAVYTARPTDAQVSTMDIEVTQPRVVPSPATP